MQKFLFKKWTAICILVLSLCLLMPIVKAVDEDYVDVIVKIHVNKEEGRLYSFNPEESFSVTTFAHTLFSP